MKIESFCKISYTQTAFDINGSIATLSHAVSHGVNLHLYYVLYAPNIDIIISFTEKD